MGILTEKWIKGNEEEDKRGVVVWCQVVVQRELQQIPERRSRVTCVALLSCVSRRVASCPFRSHSNQIHTIFQLQWRGYETHS